MNFTVGAGAEDFECTYVSMPATAGFIIGGTAEYTVGSHDLLIYRTTLSAIPVGLGKSHPRRLLRARRPAT